MEKSNEKSENLNSSFPIHVLNDTIKDIFKEFHSTLGYNIDFMGASILFATSLAIGNSMKLKVKQGWIESAICWFCIVGKSGVGKSHPIAQLLKPFRDADKEFFNEYKEALTKYNLIIQENSSKKGKSKDKTANTENEYPIKPERKQFILQDFTVESLCLALDVNPHGIGVYSDELAMWLENMNRYTKSGEEQFYLSTWSNQNISINRRSQPHIYITSPFINVIGSIQIEIMAQLLGKNRQKSGFTSRFLFAYPQKIVRENFSEHEIPDIYITTYNRYINDILRKVSNETVVIPLSKEALELFKQWRSNNNDRINNEDDGDLTGIYAKIEIYLLRLSLIMEVMDNTFDQIDTKEVSGKAFEKSIELIKYFEKTAIRANAIIRRYADPLENYPMDKRIVYAALASEFTTSAGIAIANQFNMPKRTFQDFLNDDTLFKKIKHGFYEKKL